MGPVERAVRSSIAGGAILVTPTRRRPFVVERLDHSGVVLLLGAKQAWTRISWECLEGVPEHVESHGGHIVIGGKHDVRGAENTLDGYLKRHLKRNVAGWVAVLLETAGVGAISRSRPSTFTLLPQPWSR